MVKKSLKEIYALAVCFAAVVFLIYNGATSLHNLVSVINPRMTVSGYELAKSANDEAFIAAVPHNAAVPAPADIPRLRAAALESALLAERQRGLDDLIEALTYLLVAGITFAIHWVIAKREHRIGTAS